MHYRTRLSVLKSKEGKEIDSPLKATLLQKVEHIKQKLEAVSNTYEAHLTNRLNLNSNETGQEITQKTGDTSDKTQIKVSESNNFQTSADLTANLRLGDVSRVADANVLLAPLINFSDIERFQNAQSNCQQRGPMANSVNMSSPNVNICRSGYSNKSENSNWNSVDF